MGRVIAIQEGNDGYVWSVNIVVGTNTSKTFETQILEQPAIKLVLLGESEDENNNIELKMKYLEGRSVLIENFMNGHFKSE